MQKVAEWGNGGNALIQEVVFNASGEEIEVSMLSGKEATCLLEEELAYAPELIADGRGVYGVRYSDGCRVEYWDCDEQTWDEYEREEL